MKTPTNERRVQWGFSEENTSGVYVRSLCAKCNDFTGRVYGGQYVDFVKQVLPVAVPENAGRRKQIGVKGVFPGRIVKQVISNILSTSKPTTTIGFDVVGAPRRQKKLSEIDLRTPEKKYLAEIYRELRSFVKDKHATGLPPSLKLYCFASVNKATGFRTNISCHIELDKKSVVWFAVIGWYPLHWALVFEGEMENELLNVTEWSNYKFKARVDLEIEMPCYWLTGRHPFDFKHPQQQALRHFLNTMHIEGFRPSAEATEERIVDEAVYFARTLGRVTPEGFIVSKFAGGVYYETSHFNGWLPEAGIEKALEVIEFRFQQLHQEQK